MLIKCLLGVECHVEVLTIEAAESGAMLLASKYWCF